MPRSLDQILARSLRTYCMWVGRLWKDQTTFNRRGAPFPAPGLASLT